MTEMATAQRLLSTLGGGSNIPWRSWRATTCSRTLSACWAFLDLVLLIPLGMIGGVIADRSQYEAEATRSVSEAWGGPQTFVGPTIVVPYRRVTPTSETSWHAHAAARQALDRRHTSQPLVAAARSVHCQRLYCHTRRHGRVPDQAALRELRADNRQYRLVGRSCGDRSQLKAHSVEGDGCRHRRPEGRLDVPGTGSGCRSLKAAIGPRDGWTERDTVRVRFRITLAGSSRLAARAARPADRGHACRRPGPRPASSVACRSAQTVDKDGFRARWSASDLGRPYSQLWDSASTRNDPTV